MINSWQPWMKTSNCSYDYGISDCCCLKVVHNVKPDPVSCSFHLSEKSKSDGFKYLENALMSWDMLSAHFYQMMTAQRLLWLIKTCHVVKKSPRVSPLSRLQQHLLEKLMKPSALNTLFCWWSWPAYIQRQPFIWSLSKGLLCRIFKAKFDFGEISHIKLFFRPIEINAYYQCENSIFTVL